MAFRPGWALSSGDGGGAPEKAQFHRQNDTVLVEALVLDYRVCSGSNRVHPAKLRRFLPGQAVRQAGGKQQQIHISETGR